MLNKNVIFEKAKVPGEWKCVLHMKRFKNVRNLQNRKILTTKTVEPVPKKWIAEKVIKNPCGYKETFSNKERITKQNEKSEKNPVDCVVFTGF